MARRIRVGAAHGRHLLWVLAILAVACTDATTTAHPPSPSAVATSPAVTTPSPTTPSSAPPSPSAVASTQGFQPQSVTFVSLDEGWVLGARPCASMGGWCTAMERTVDGGRSWSPASAPSAAFAPTAVTGNGGEGVAQVRFADPRDGWAFGYELWSTHDGGVQWRKQSLGTVWSVETAAGVVHAVVYRPDGSVVVETSPTGSDAWTVTGALTLGAGPVPSADLVLQGRAGWVIENDRAVVGGARLVNGRWVSWNPPCTTAGGQAMLSAPTSSWLVAACQENVWFGTGPPAAHLYVSSNAGSTFHPSGISLPQDEGFVVASPTPGTVVIDSGSSLIETFDGGTTWIHVLSAAVQGFTYLGFTSPSQGVAIGGHPGEQVDNQMFMTYDGGRDWHTVRF